MAKKANTTMIGAFVVIAFLLLAISVVILGSGKLFKQTTNFVLYFDSSINGLSVGSPVLLQGVQIGSVTGIMIHANRENLTMSIPVIIEVRHDKFYVEDRDHNLGDPKETIAKLIDKGLRAVLSMQSLITGQLMIELDYHPEIPVNLKNLNADYPEIPTMQSTTERLIQTLRKIDFTGLVDNIKNTLNGINRLANNSDLAEGLKAFRQTAEESRQLVGKLDRRIDDVIDSLENTLTDTRLLVNNANGQLEHVVVGVDDVIDSVEDTLDDTRSLVNNANGQLEPVVEDVKQMVNDFDELARNLDKNASILTARLNESLSDVRGVVSADAPLVLQMQETLENISNMTDSIRQLADFLEQHPESILKGK